MLSLLHSLTRLIDRIAFYLFLLVLSLLFFSGKLSSLPLTIVLSLLLSVGLFSGFSMLHKKHDSAAGKRWKRNRLALSSMPKEKAEEILYQAFIEIYDVPDGVSVLIALHPEKVTPNEVYETRLKSENKLCVLIAVNDFTQEAKSYAKGLSPAVVLVPASSLPLGELPQTQKQKRKKSSLLSDFQPIKGFCIGTVLFILFILTNRISLLAAGLIVAFLSLFLKNREERKPSLFDA